VQDATFGKVRGAAGPCSFNPRLVAALATKNPKYDELLSIFADELLSNSAADKVLFSLCGR